VAAHASSSQSGDAQSASHCTTHTCNSHNNAVANARYIVNMMAQQ
jgi:hypothetical protein